MRRRAFALVPVLWVVVVLGVTVIASSSNTTETLRAARNGHLIRAAEWARAACLNVIAARLTHVRADSSIEHARRVARARASLLVARTPIGSAANCETIPYDIDATLNVNALDSATLACVVRDERIAARLLANRPFPTEATLNAVLRETAPLVAQQRLLSTRGGVRPNVNTAPERLIECARGVSPWVAAAVAMERRRGRTFDDLAEIAPILPRVVQDEFLRLYMSAAIDLVAQSPTLGLLAIGSAGTPPIESRWLLTLRLRGAEVDVLEVREDL